MSKRKRILLLLAVAIAGLLLALLGRPALHLARTAWSDQDRRVPIPSGHVDDASGLNLARVEQLVAVEADPAKAEEQLRALLALAKEKKLPVSIAGARHSMGGHTIAPGGIYLDMRPLRRVAYDAATERVTCGAGATWAEVFAALNPLGRSLDIVQSFSNFSVGGSISVNAHGWQHRRPPLVAAVESMRVLVADGRVVRCSRTEEPELFSLVAGGYGLFGVILEAELRTVPNVRYRLERAVLASERLEQEFATRATVPGATLAFARLDVTPSRFLREAILTVFHEEPPEPGVVPLLSEPRFAAIRREVLRGSVGSDYGKELRWSLEKTAGEHLTSSLFYRNQVIYDDWTLYENRDPAFTEILQEYFLPIGAMEAFLAEVRRIVPAHEVDLVNLTVRWSTQDTDSFLRWADRDVSALVFFFHHPRTPEADAALEPLTRELIDAALALGGRYYLPYRLQATKQQLVAAYPRAPEFFQKKLAWDPHELFQNRWYLAYR
jgi:FAD/FMN-containing dehydrogenase